MRPPGSAIARSKRFFASLVVTSLVLVGLVACGQSPAQIVDYAPLRGAIDVSTAAPIHITFDHDVNKPSVESRLHLVPATNGAVHWLSSRQLTYEHRTLAPSTTYQVVLEGGYTDIAGNTYMLRHHWSFVTEGPPSLAGSTPANGEGDVDPVAYLTLNFTREMDEASLQGAITITPSAPFSVRLDPADGRRAIIAPAALLDPSTRYTIAVSTVALDADGNQLDRDQTLVFNTGAVRALRHWVAFATQGSGGTQGGVWIVNESGFPRQLFGSAGVQSFSWSPEGDRILIQGDNESWSVFTPGQDPLQLGFRATWAAALASGLGYAYIDDKGALHRLSAEGTDLVIAGAVAQAVVAPGGERLAFIDVGAQSSVIWGYDIGLNAQYQLAQESAPIIGLAWAPAGNRIGYLRQDIGTMSLRVRNLTGTSETLTVASGDLGAPAWLPDSTHIVFAAATPTATGTVHKAFVVNVIGPPAALTPALGLPSDPTIDVANPVPSPDGHQLAFVSADQVWLMNGDGTRPTPLTRFDSGSFPYSCRTPAWTRA
ncbi:MAG TPA: Ig-like domain-containing protein [Candidatus Dormibacteraeota bacterium]|nr:Ig-like domain-containing protein [Candidatus Dormibacteraeota bacterium]